MNIRLVLSFISNFASNWICIVIGASHKSSDKFSLKRFLFLNLLVTTICLAAPHTRAQDITSSTGLNPGPQCVFDHKDYDSPGFSLPYRSGFKIIGQFGCVYSCDCAERRFRVTHTFRESHFDIGVLSKDTGGPKRAKWFICPRSVKPESWTARNDELGRLLYYDVEPEDRPFSAHGSKIIELELFCK